MVGQRLLPGDPAYSQWASPWLYPSSNLAGDRVGWEANLAHVGPWLQGDTASSLLDQVDTHVVAAARSAEPGRHQRGLRHQAP